jgi:hypothetical protein
MKQRRRRWNDLIHQIDTKKCPEKFEEQEEDTNEQS